MSFWSKLASLVLVVLIATAGSILFVLNQGDRLQEQVESYPAGSTSISLSGVSEDQSADVLSTLRRFTRAGGRAIVRIDPQSNSVDGGLTGLRIGVDASPRTPPPALDLRFLGTTLFDTATISTLLTSDPAKSIGLDANSADVIATIPELAFAPRISVVQLSHLVDVSGTINGTYRIVGADRAQVEDLLKSLAPVTGLTPESMLAPSHGQVTNSGLMSSILLGCMIAASILLLVVLVFEAVRSLPVLGVHLLLGKSRWAFAIGTFRPVLITTGTTVALSMLLTSALARGYQLNTTLLTATWGAAIVGAGLVLACVAIAVSVLTTTKPVTAIMGRSSKRALLWVVAASSVLAVGGFSFLLVFIDGPIKEAGKLSDVRQTWSSVEDQQILYRLSPGDDEAGFTGQSSRLAKDFFDWYRSIADQPGVMLVNSEHFDDKTLKDWSGTYDSVPTRPFWLLAASPGYLAAQGFPVSAGIVARAERGERVFLLPGTWPDSAKTAMRGWLNEDSHPSGEPSIRTKYFDHERVGFEEYSPKTPLFTWTTDPTLPTTVTSPVILVATPANMVPFESESLYAVGLENSYVKLSADAARTYTSTRYLAQFHLDDNDVEFLPVSDFIAGLTKTIHATLQLFGGVILFAVLLLVATLIALMRLFSTTYREQLTVKRMLGYSLARLFAAPILVIGLTGLIAVGIAIQLQSKSAIVGNLVLLAIQGVLVTCLIRRYARLQLSAALNE